MTTAAAPSEIELELAAVTGAAIFFERRLQRGDLFGRRLRRLLVVIDDDIALSAADGYGRDLPCERAILVGGERARKRRRRECVLRLPRERKARRAFLGERAHQPALVIRILEPVEKHVIVDGLMGHPVTGPRLRHQVRRVRHALHPARDDDVGRFRDQRVVREDHRLHRRAAHLVHRRAAGRERQSRLDGRLPRRRLSLSGGQHATEDRLVDVGRA
jgi:hypothetical protein